MKTYIYEGGLGIVAKSGVGSAIKHQKNMLKQADIEEAKSWKEADIVHINTVFPDSVLAACLAKMQGKKVVYYGHSTMEDFRNSFIGSNRFAPLFKKWICFCYGLGDIVITPTEYSKGLLKSYGIQKKIYAVSNGVDTEFFQSRNKEKEKQELHEKYKIPMNRKVVVSAGHLIQRKGILDFLKLAKMMPETTFIWFGGGNDSLVTQEVKEAVKKAGITLQDCVSVGIGSPGYCRAAEGLVVYANNLGWKNVPLCDELRQELGVPVRLSNDANCAALGEVFAGAAKGAKSAIMITLGTGVGGGVILNGKIYEGDIGPGTEMGHTTLILGGEPCTCGQRGCLEAYASATGLLRQRHRAELAHPETAMKRFNPADGSAPFICAAEGDETAKAVVEQYITYVGAGIVNFVNIFAPEVVLIGGGVSNAGESLIGPLNDYVRANRYGGHRAPTCPIRRAALGGDAGIIGAAYLDFEV